MDVSAVYINDPKANDQGVNINHILFPKTGRFAWGWRNAGGYMPDSGLHGPSGTGIEAYKSPVAPRLGAPATVLFGSRSRVGF